VKNIITNRENIKRNFQDKKVFNVKIQEIIGKRIAESRKKKKLTLKALAELSKGRLTYSRVANWEAGTRTPGPDDAVLLGRLLDVSPSYLLGLSGDEEGNIFIRHAQTVNLPFLEGLQLTNPLESLSALRLKQTQETKYLALSISDKEQAISDYSSFFALRVEDDGMSPRINVGDVAIIDGAQKPKPGAFVAAITPDYSGVIIRQYKQRNIDRNFTSFELIPLNDNWASVIVDQPNTTRIIGIVYQTIHNYV